MKYDIAAKPTLYEGRLYRSRLEARWAAFFDFIRWDFEYEPEPLATWSPDFLITDYLGGMYLEIKPYSLWDDALMNKIKAYTPFHKCGLLAEEITVEENKFYIGKQFTKNDNKLLFKDLAVPYYGSFTPTKIKMLWSEAANKVMYLKPKEYNG